MRSMRLRREGDMRLHVSEGDMKRVESVEWCLPVTLLGVVSPCHSSQSPSLAAPSAMCTAEL
jgi:hypothetical protein